VTGLVARTLAGLIGLLALVLVVEWLPSSGPAVPVIAPPRLSAGAHEGTRLAVRETDAWVNAILARPLFSIGRRPPKPAVVRSAGTDEGIPRLSGIMIAAGFKRAIFAPDGGGKPLVLTEGQTLADTSIRSIEPGEVVLASGEVLHPAYDKNRVPTPYIPPGLPNPAFANPNFGQPGFQPPNMLPPNFQPGGAAAQGTEMPQPGPPPFRGMMPQRRE
jgi:hypothetical protein